MGGEKSAEQADAEEAPETGEDEKGKWAKHTTWAEARLDAVGGRSSEE